MSNKNKKNSTIIQALLDCQDAGLGNLTIQQAVAHLQKDNKLATALDQKFRNRTYSKSSVKYTQLSIHQGLMELPPAALKLLVFLGMYSNQEGKISIDLKSLARATGMSVNSCRDYINLLKDRGLLATCDGARRHEPPIWQVNPEILYSGKRMHQASRANDFHEICKAGGGRYYPLDYKPELVVNRDSVTRDLGNGRVIHYYKITLTTKKEPSGEPEDPNPTSKENDTKNNQSRQETEIPGQIAFDLNDIDESITFREDK